MTHVVTDNCRGCKFTDCVLTCPVDCFYELEDMLVISPDECIDCAGCVSACPVEAIYSDQEIPEDQNNMLEFNAKQSLRLRDSGDEPIHNQKDPLPTAKQRQAELGF